jgi:hypothetical protein
MIEGITSPDALTAGPVTIDGRADCDLAEPVAELGAVLSLLFAFLAALVVLPGSWRTPRTGSGRPRPGTQIFILHHAARTLAP